MSVNTDTVPTGIILYGTVKYRYAYYSRSNTDALDPYRHACGTALRARPVLRYAVAAATDIEAELRELEQLIRLKHSLGAQVGVRVDTPTLKAI